MGSRPSVAILQLHLLCLFASGIVMSSWVWTHSTLEIWRRYIKGKFGYDVEQPVRMQKHKMIALAFSKRKAFQEEGRLSISFRNTHTDPVGLNFNIDSASQDFSSTWANNLPRFVNRRCALTGAVTSSSHEPRRNSMDSEISFSVRHVSVESRRNSVDSQVSVKIAEMKTKVASRSRGRKGKRMRRHDPSGGERCQELLELDSVRRKGGGKAKRRSASAGLNPKEISSLLANGKVLLPLLNNQRMASSDEENASMASFHMKDSRLDVILKRIGNHGQTSDDESHDFTIQDSSVNMKEYNTADDRRDSLNSIKSERKKDSFSSLDSEVSLAPPIHSSYSGGKSTSRNSKRSCDVGIQANAHEITTQLNLAENENLEGGAGICKKWPMEKGNRKNDDESTMSQTDKLKLLLLPSK